MCDINAAVLHKYNTTDTLNFAMKKNYKSYKEKDLYQYIKKNMPSIMFTRLENFSVQGTPDILAYHNKHHFFTIENKGTAPLELGNDAISFSGVDAQNFAITAIALPLSIAANSSTTFNVVFTPSEFGEKNAIIHISNSDCNESDYNFAIK